MPLRFHIEFIGLPGAGKSTLRREVVAYALQCGISLLDLDAATYKSLDVATEDRVLRHALRLLPTSVGHRMHKGMFRRSTDSSRALRRFMLQQKQLVHVVLRSFQRREAFERHPDVLFSWLLDLFAAYQLIQDRLPADCGLVLDEGFCNRALSLYSDSFSEADVEDLTAYVGSIPRPDAVLLVDASPHVCNFRLSTNGWPARAAALDVARRAHYLKDVSRCVETLARLLEERGIRVHRIPNEGSLKSAVSTLQMAVASVLEEHGVDRELQIRS